MAKEWYLLSSSTKPNSIGGYENEVFEDYKDDAFSETLETDLGITVILYNHDLSESQEVRCIIQGNTADTQLKSMERIGLFEIGTVKAGMYLFFENRYWLIDGYPGTQGIYEKATMCLCQYNLRWQNAQGNIVERWCNITSASKYDVGESGNKTIFLTSNNYTIKMPYDKETIELETKRVFIDKRKTKPTKVFKLTRNDDILYDYGNEDHGSILSFIADKDEFNGKTDNQELRICDYISSISTNLDNPSYPTNEMVVSIIGDDTLRVGKTKIWSVIFKDKEGNDVEFKNWKWQVFDADYLIWTFDEKRNMKLIIKDDSYVDKTFIIAILNSTTDEILSQKEITIIDGF